MFRFFLLAMTTTFVAGCQPLPTDDAGTTDETTDSDDTSGRVWASPFSVTWGWSDSWPEGNCTELRAEVSGVDVANWELDFTLDNALDRLTWSDGAEMEIVGTHLVMRPWDEGALAAGDDLQLEYCGEPQTRITALEVTYDRTDDTDDPGSGGLFGTLVDSTNTLGLIYEEDGTENGGKCLEIKVANLTSQTLTDWKLTVTLSEAAALTHISGLLFFPETSTSVLVLPDADSQEIGPYGTQIGRMCTTVQVVPEGFQATFETD